MLACAPSGPLWSRSGGCNSPSQPWSGSPGSITAKRIKLHQVALLEWERCSNSVRWVRCFSRRIPGAPRRRWYDPRLGGGVSALRSRFLSLGSAANRSTSSPSSLPKWCRSPRHPVTRCPCPGGRLDHFCVLPVVRRQGPQPSSKSHHTLGPAESNMSPWFAALLGPSSLTPSQTFTPLLCFNMSPLSPPVTILLVCCSSCPVVKWSTQPCCCKFRMNILRSFVGVSWHWGKWANFQYHSEPRRPNMALVCGFGILQDCSFSSFQPGSTEMIEWFIECFPREWVVQLTTFSRNLFEPRAHLFAWRPTNSSGLANLIANLGVRSVVTETLQAGDAAVIGIKGSAIVSLGQNTADHGCCATILMGLWRSLWKFNTKLHKHCISIA